MKLITWLKSVFQGNKPSKDVRAVCFGMGDSRQAGSCPGAVLDAMRMSDLLEKWASAGCTTLLSQNATKQAAVDAMLEAVGHRLAIVFYSGHGGRDSKDAQNAFGETDRRNEYLCFYDRLMADDEVWSVVGQAKGRVLLVFDCCHSGTMYRSLDVYDKADERVERTVLTGSFPFTLGRYREAADAEERAALALADAQSEVGMSQEEIHRIYSRSRRAVALSTPNLLVWSAAQEHEYSYGSTAGGVFTNALLAAYGKRRTYDSVWNGIVRRMKGEPNTPVRTAFGSGFDGRVFR